MSQRHRIIPAAYLVLMKDQKVLFLRRFNTGYEDGKYSFVAGHVESGETYTQCVVREAKEEAGIVLKPEDVRVAHVMHRNTGDVNNERMDIFFVAEKWSGDITNREPHKCDDLSWFDIDHCPHNSIAYIAYAIEQIKNGVQYSEYGW